MSSTANPRQELFRAFAGVARAMGNPHRLHLVEQLAQGERNVDSLAARTGLTVANASQHLQALRRAGLVEGRRDGKQIIYKLASDSVLEIVASLRRVAEEQVRVVREVAEAYFAQRDELEPVSIEELASRAEAGLVTILDVRPEDEFRAGHLPCAINVPLADLPARLRELPREREIVAYCRGPWCVLAFEAVAELRAGGWTARRLEGGLPEWRLAGRPVVVEPLV